MCRPSPTHHIRLQFTFRQSIIPPVQFIQESLKLLFRKHAVRHHFDTEGLASRHRFQYFPCTQRIAPHLKDQRIPFEIASLQKRGTAGTSNEISSHGGVITICLAQRSDYFPALTPVKHLWLRGWFRRLHTHLLRSAGTIHGQQKSTSQYIKSFSFHCFILFPCLSSQYEDKITFYFDK